MQSGADLCLILTKRSPGVSRAKPPDHCQPAACNRKHNCSLGLYTLGQCTARAPPASKSLSIEVPYSKKQHLLCAACFQAMNAVDDDPMLGCRRPRSQA